MRRHTRERAKCGGELELRVTEFKLLGWQSSTVDLPIPRIKIAISLRSRNENTRQGSCVAMPGSSSSCWWLKQEGGIQGFK